MIERPRPGEIGEYYFRYIDRVPQGADVLKVIEAQRDSTGALLRGIGEEQSRERYSPGKWSIRQVLGHVTDTELVFLFRAFWFARGFDTPLPSFDENPAAELQRAHDVSWASLVDAFDGVRSATIGFFRNLPADAWARSGVASGNPFTVRALAFVVAGHVSHHEAVLRERYLNALPDA
jgi:DinB superfamily